MREVNTAAVARGHHRVGVAVTLVGLRARTSVCVCVCVGAKDTGWIRGKGHVILNRNSVVSGLK